MERTLFDKAKKASNRIRSSFLYTYSAYEFALVCVLAQTVAMAFERIPLRYSLTLWGKGECRHRQICGGCSKQGLPVGRRLKARDCARIEYYVGSPILTPKHQCARLPRHTQGQHADRKATRHSAFSSLSYEGIRRPILAP